MFFAGMSSKDQVHHLMVALLVSPLICVTA